MITAAQIRMGRAGVHISVRALAKLAGLSAMTVTRIENGHSGGYGETLRKIQIALESLGVEFTNGDAEGVKLRKPITTAIGRNRRK